MRGIRYSLRVPVALLGIAGIAVTSLAQARNIWQSMTVSHRDGSDPAVCIDKLYRIIQCRVSAYPVVTNQLAGPTVLHHTDTQTGYLIFTLKKGHCQHKSNRRPGLLRALFPGLPDLSLELDQFAVHVETPSNLSNISDSTLYMGYRNCW